MAVAGLQGSSACREVGMIAARFYNIRGGFPLQHRPEDDLPVCMFQELGLARPAPPCSSQRRAV